MISKKTSLKSARQSRDAGRKARARERATEKDGAAAADMWADFPGQAVFPTVSGARGATRSGEGVGLGDIQP